MHRRLKIRPKGISKGAESGGASAHFVQVYEPGWASLEAAIALGTSSKGEASACVDAFMALLEGVGNDTATASMRDAERRFASRNDGDVGRFEEAVDRLLEAGILESVGEDPLGTVVASLPPEAFWKGNRWARQSRIQARQRQCAPTAAGQDLVRYIQLYRPFFSLVAGLAKTGCVAMRLAVFMAKRIDSHGLLCCSQTALAQAADCSVRAAATAVEQLEREGFFKRLPWGRLVIFAINPDMVWRSRLRLRLNSPFRAKPDQDPLQRLKQMTGLNPIRLSVILS